MIIEVISDGVLRGGRDFRSGLRHADERVLFVAIGGALEAERAEVSRLVTRPCRAAKAIQG